MARIKWFILIIIFFSSESYGVNSSEFRKFLEELDSLINNEPVEDIQNAAKYTEILQKLGYDSEKLMFEVSNSKLRLF